MKKRPIIWIVVMIATAALAAFLYHLQQLPGGPAITDKDVMQRAKELGIHYTNTAPATPPLPLPLKPLLLNHPVRLAIGALGMEDSEQNGKLDDLVLARLTGTPGLDLVERQDLEKVLSELNLSLDGFVRANDAVRVGKLLRADWFLLGTEAKIAGTNSIVARVVDARTGILRDAGVIPDDKPLAQVAADLAAFLRESRQSAADPKPRVFLALGAFEDSSVNNRQADFPNQLRSYLTAAYHGSRVTLLEREYVETLLQEVHLDMAGLTEENWSNSPPAMQSAYWLVDGRYQSYETTNVQIELNLEVSRAFGDTWQRALRALPGEPIGRETKAAIDNVIEQNSGYSFLTRRNEVLMQMEIGEKLSGNQIGNKLVWVDDYWDGDPQIAAKLERKVEDAIRAFQTALLLEPTNREARIYLAASLRHFTILRNDEARDLYREILEEPVRDKWVHVAQDALVESFRLSSLEEKARWFAAARMASTNAAMAEFYQKNAEFAARDVAINRHDENSAALAQKLLLEMIRSSRDSLAHKGDNYYSGFGLYQFENAFPDHATAAKAVTELLPTLEQTFPDVGPHLAAVVLSLQVDTNPPALLEYEKTLDWCIAHPKEVFQGGSYWTDYAGTAYQWLTGYHQYALAVKTMEGWRAAAQQGVVQFDDEDRLALGYAYMGVERWQDALGVFENFNNKTVKPSRDGPWGRGWQLVLTGELAARCRTKLGLAPANDPREFDLGQPVMCLCTPSTFAADENGLWVGIGGRLLYLDFELKTNLDVRLPIDASMPVTTICPTSDKIWIGTQGAGLIEFDKASRQCCQFTETNGLMMNELSSLQVAGDFLWIGYGNAIGGGFGRMDLRSQKLTSYMPSINSGSTPHIGEEPPNGPMGNIVVGAEGDLWMWAGYAVRHFDIAQGSWETSPNQLGGWLRCFAMNSRYLIEGGDMNMGEIEISSKPTRDAPTNQITRTRLVGSMAEINRLRASFNTTTNFYWISFFGSGPIETKGTLAIQNLHDHQWKHLEDADGFPHSPTTLALDGDDLWVGSEGAIALVDLKENRVKKICRVKTTAVDRIQIAGGYVWVQFDWHLYRAPLSVVQ